MRIAKITHTFAITQLLIITFTLNSCKPLDGGKFNAQRALKDMEFQVGLGPRVLGSAAHENTKMYIGELSSIITPSEFTREWKRGENHS
jgi:hypothetical protein